MSGGAGLQQWKRDVGTSCLEILSVSLIKKQTSKLLIKRLDQLEKLFFIDNLPMC